MSIFYHEFYLKIWNNECTLLVYKEALEHNCKNLYSLSAWQEHSPNGFIQSSNQNSSQLTYPNLWSIRIKYRETFHDTIKSFKSAALNGLGSISKLITGNPDDS